MYCMIWQEKIYLRPVCFFWFTPLDGSHGLKPCPLSAALNVCSCTGLFTITVTYRKQKRDDNETSCYCTVFFFVFFYWTQDTTVFYDPIRPLSNKIETTSNITAE